MIPLLVKEGAGVVDFLSTITDLPSRQPGTWKARFWRLVVAFCAQTGFIFGSFCTSSKSDALYFQQLPGFVPAILCFSPFCHSERP
jgi:hypothetical protein